MRVGSFLCSHCNRAILKRGVEKDILIAHSFYAHLATVQTLTPDSHSVVAEATIEEKKIHSDGIEGDHKIFITLTR